ncbi:MAG: M24 family metallopeptidase [Bacillota bacterium]
MEKSQGNKVLASGWRRILELQKALVSLDLSGGIIHRPENIYYYSGVFPNEPSFVIIPCKGEPELVVARASYHEALRESLIPVIAGDLDICQTVKQRLYLKGCLLKEGDTPLKKVWSSLRAKPLGVEYDFFNPQLKVNLKVEKIADICAAIQEMRMIKDKAEIEYIAEACRIADEAMMEALPLIKPGMTEREVSGLFDRFVKAKGADESKARVRAGKNSAFAFTKWMGGCVVEGPLLIDYGARVKGYWSDITRTFYVGRHPDPRFRDAYNLLHESLKKGFEKMVPGGSIYQVEAAIRQVLSVEGLDQNMIFTAGHGVGLEIHENPVLSLYPEKAAEDGPNFPNWHQGARTYETLVKMSKKDAGPVFQKGQVFALEPGVYLQDIGIRIEDMVLIDDRPRFLSNFPRALEDVLIKAQ